MQQMVMGVMAVLIGLVVLMIEAGWIVPLILSIIGRRRHWPSARVLRVLTVIWGGMAVLLALGVGGSIFTASRMSRGNESKAPLFKATDYGGKTARLCLAYTGEVECVIKDQAGKSFRCASSNGMLTVPAGTLAILECKVMALDSAGKPWTALFRSWNETHISVRTDAVQNVEFGPPFLLAVNMEWTPVSSKIRLEPACADRAGNIYTIKGDPKGAVPSFQLLDTSLQVIWSGKFEAG